MTGGQLKGGSFASGSTPDGSTISAKDIVVKPINARLANSFVQKNHYSGKVVPNSQIHLGCYLDGKLGGVMQFGPSINKKGSINIVAETLWNGFIELNRMAFSDMLPRNSESRCIAVAMKIIKKNYPFIEWVISFADAAQCGDGTIYRASGFVLTGIRDSNALRKDPETGEVIHVIQAHHLKKSKEFRSWEAVEGYQLRYVYFINKNARKRLMCEEIPFSKIKEMGISMYKGEKTNACEA